MLLSYAVAPLMMRPTQCAAAAQLLALWSILTFLLFICSLALNAALSLLFFLLGLTFALLAAGVQHETTDKVAGALPLALSRRDACHRHESASWRSAVNMSTCSTLLASSRTPTEVLRIRDLMWVATSPDHVP